MRRALRRQLPAITRFYGLRPQDLDDMTFGEVAEYLAGMPREAPDGDSGT